MNGYQYLIQRNRLMCQLEDQLRALGPLPDAEYAEQKKRLEAQFDLKLRKLYGEVAGEYPGERPHAAHAGAPAKTG